MMKIDQKIRQQEKAQNSPREVPQTLDTVDIVSDPQMGQPTVEMIDDAPSTERQRLDLQEQQS